MGLLFKPMFLSLLLFLLWHQTEGENFSNANTTRLSRARELAGRCNFFRDLINSTSNIGGSPFPATYQGLMGWISWRGGGGRG
ncbi:unnamed protein product, partial [Vitis vinifera]